MKETNRRGSPGIHMESSVQRTFVFYLSPKQGLATLLQLAYQKKKVSQGKKFKHTYIYHI